MSQRSVELSVGIFVLIGLVALGWISVRLGGLGLFETDTYELKAKFTNVTGLRTGASVEMAGVHIGRVTRIALDGEEAIVTVRLERDVRLARDAIASIRTKGILGDKYMSVSQGGAEEKIPPGGRIRETEPPIDIEKLIGEFIFGKLK